MSVEWDTIKQHIDETYVNKIIPYSPELPTNNRELPRGSEEGQKTERKGEEEAKRERRREQRL